MGDPNRLLSRIEDAGLWAYFHKDWLLEIRALLRPQLPAQFYVFVESEAIHYTMLIHRGAKNEIVAVLEVLSPSNKGIGNRLDQEKHLRKRSRLLDAGVNLLEVDALLNGERVLPTPLADDLSQFTRVAWSAFHDDGHQKLRGWGWNEGDALPVIPWVAESGVNVLVDLPQALERACEFNRWEDLIQSAEREP